MQINLDTFFSCVVLFFMVVLPGLGVGFMVINSVVIAVELIESEIRRKKEEKEG